MKFRGPYTVTFKTDIWNHWGMFPSRYSYDDGKMSYFCKVISTARQLMNNLILFSVGSGGIYQETIKNLLRMKDKRHLLYVLTIPFCRLICYMEYSL